MSINSSLLLYYVYFDISLETTLVFISHFWAKINERAGKEGVQQKSFGAPFHKQKKWLREWIVYSGLESMTKLAYECIPRRFQIFLLEISTACTFTSKTLQQRHFFVEFFFNKPILYYNPGWLYLSIKALRTDMKYFTRNKVLEKLSPQFWLKILLHKN